MKKDHLTGSLHQNTEEVLEISSTGYGLESVVKKPDKENPAFQRKDNPSNCGGL